MNFFRQTFLIIFQIIFLSNAANANQTNNPKKIPTKVSSNIIDIKKNLHVIDFIGNVVVEKNQDSILADKMTLFYQENKSGDQKAKSKIEKIEASDNVKFFSKDYVATSKNGYYDPSKDSLTLENDVIVNNGTSIAKGDKFIYNFKTKKGNLTGQSSEDRATIIIENDKPLK
jgi:lipopolysaccharide transport protein LptA